MGGRVALGLGMKLEGPRNEARMALGLGTRLECPRAWE